MDFVIHNSVSSMTSSQNSLHSSSSSDTSFPIIAIAVIGILATAFLLISYYIFVIKCCLTWHQIDILRRFSLSRDRTHEELLMVYSPGIETRGLDESVIRSIPVFHFKKTQLSGENEEQEKQISDHCAVCLSEFNDEEKLRIIPNCNHIFHIDCIDVWLQNNANCPLCRRSISPENRFAGKNPIFAAPTSSPVDPTGNLAGAGEDEEDYLVIEISNPNNNNNNNVNNHNYQNRNRNRKKQSMGDECIVMSREKDHHEEFSMIQPIRRSFSMDSSGDRKMFLAIQEALQLQRQRLEVSSSNSNSNSNSNSPIVEGRSIRRSFFSFGGHASRGSSRSSSVVLPIYLE
ncbi:hypothetical protein G4B88_004800 [Cannabis sativa]|uniref:RING-type E3 ubiquitin transferase n=1 Tax=Cannabis sativa TaxID=3483 RepID=A0A7J6FV52_CANSA|nr:hypothetical protein G4B88_004800 [Cannabis sativa]